jgi:cation transport ATPase
MNESQKRFVDQLLAADPPSADARQHYEKERRAMFEKTLTRNERRSYLVVAVLMGLLALTWGLPALFAWVDHSDNEGTQFIAAFLLLTALALLVVAGLLFWGWWQGVVNRRTSNDWAAGAGVVYVSLVGCLLMMMGESLPERLRDVVRVVGVVFLVYAAVAWMRRRIGQAELRTAEKLLEIELRLAEIGEALQARPKPTDPASPQPPPV